MAQRAAPLTPPPDFMQFLLLQFPDDDSYFGYYPDNPNILFTPTPTISRLPNFLIPTYPDDQNWEETLSDVRRRVIKRLVNNIDRFMRMSSVVRRAGVQVEGYVFDVLKVGVWGRGGEKGKVVEVVVEGLPSLRYMDVLMQFRQMQLDANDGPMDGGSGGV